MLENSQASAYSGYFDIDWQPLKEELRGKVLIPVLVVLRIDHPDGLYDPLAYYRRLRAALRERRIDPEGFYLVVEKILAADERLPDNWPVHGTTGYDFANLLNGLYLDPAAGERPLTRLYERFTGRRHDFGELVYQCK